MNPLLYEQIIATALREDLGFGDITSESLVNPLQQGTAKITAKQEGIVAGIEVAKNVFKLVDPSLNFQASITDGDKVKPGTSLATISGGTRSILSGERVALNFLQRLSGIATGARRAANTVKDFNCRIVDTRKTTPGLRMLEKYAVRVGGGYNHRFGLFDAVLIKDNHIAAAGGITAAVESARQKVGHMVKIEVEVEDLVQAREALAVQADIIMFDNMDTTQMAAGVKLVAGRALTEASGNITLASLAQVAATGVNLISLGWLTHSAPALDLSLKLF